ncbi:MAG: type II secretion system protein GspK, partial [Candidatus Omnitrophica bacterium]|nr:type II secretion system protein GspK [Candidatus Omnitrophota bacterium]
AIKSTRLQGQLTSRPRVKTNPAFNEASVLIIVLWVLCLLSTFAVVSSYGVRQKLGLINRLEERDKLRYITEAGVKKAIAVLKNGPVGSYGAFRDVWSNNPGAFSNIRVGDGEVSVSYEFFDDATGVTRMIYGLIDEERKININKVAPRVLERLFRIVLKMEEAQAQELSASIIDWRDSGGEGATAQDYYYMNLQYPYEAKHADFELLEEVLLVKGMDDNIFGKVKDWITVYGDGKVNINTASASVLGALGLNDDIVDKLLSYRSGEDRTLGTADDNVFDTNSNIASVLSQAFQLSDPQIAQLSLVAAETLGTSSSNFMVKSNGRLLDRKATSEVTCVADRQGKILYWRQK